MTENDVQKKVKGFYSAFGFLQCIGAIERTCVESKQLKLSSTNYINRSHNSV